MLNIFAEYLGNALKKNKTEYLYWIFTPNIWKFHGKKKTWIFVLNISTEYLDIKFKKNIVDYLYWIFPLNISIFGRKKNIMKGWLQTYTYLYGLTVVNKNRSVNPLSCHTVLPIATIAWKNGWGCTPGVMDVELGGTNRCLIPANVDLSPSPSKSWLSKPILLSCFTSWPLISWKKLEASSVTTIP